MTAQDTDAAVSALHAAGDDIEALVEAIEQASFLDDIPGEDRQKLRGECSGRESWGQRGWGGPQVHLHMLQVCGVCVRVKGCVTRRAKEEAEE